MGKHAENRCQKQKKLNYLPKSQKAKSQIF